MAYFYHGIDKKFIYRLGYLLLDLRNPRKIIKGSNIPILEPKMDYELHGFIDIVPEEKQFLQKKSKKGLLDFIHLLEKRGGYPEVVFCSGAILRNGKVRIFYGAGDYSICTATADLNEILRSK